jgi:hypothetical protein
MTVARGLARLESRIRKRKLQQVNFWQRNCYLDIRPNFRGWNKISFPSKSCIPLFLPGKKNSNVYSILSHPLKIFSDLMGSKT